MELAATVILPLLLLIPGAFLLYGAGPIRACARGS